MTAPSTGRQLRQCPRSPTRQEAPHEVGHPRPPQDRPHRLPWLIRRFIDPDAEILYVPTDQVLAVAADEGAHSFDAPAPSTTTATASAPSRSSSTTTTSTGPRPRAPRPDRPRRRHRRRDPHRPLRPGPPGHRPRRARRRSRRPPPSRTRLVRLRRPLRLVRAAGHGGHGAHDVEPSTTTTCAPRPSSRSPSSWPPPPSPPRSRAASCSCRASTTSWRPSSSPTETPRPELPTWLRRPGNERRESDLVPRRRRRRSGRRGPVRRARRLVPTQLRLRRLRLRHLRRVPPRHQPLRDDSAELEFAGPVCNLRDIDLGIAVGSAAKTAAIHSIDCRCQTRIAVAARKLGIITADHAVALSLSMTHKSVGFDRAHPRGRLRHPRSPCRPARCPLRRRRRTPRRRPEPPTTPHQPEALTDRTVTASATSPGRGRVTSAPWRCHRLARSCHPADPGRGIVLVWASSKWRSCMPSMRPPWFGSPRRRRRSGGRGGSGRGGDGRFAPCGRSTDRRPARLCVPVGDERGPQATPVVASSGASRGSCSLRSSGSRTRSIVPEVVAALRRLSPQQRAVIHLTYWEDLTPTTVAARLGIREGNRSPAARAWSSTPGGGARWALSRTSVNSVRRRVNGSRSRWGWSVTRRRRRGASTGCSTDRCPPANTRPLGLLGVSFLVSPQWPGSWLLGVHCSRSSGRPIESENRTDSPVTTAPSQSLRATWHRWSPRSHRRPNRAQFDEAVVAAADAAKVGRGRRGSGS